MADEPISALTLLSSYSTADEVEILDVSDTTFASTGTNKRIQFSSLLTMAGVGTVAGGGTGLTAVGSADQLLGVAHTGGALEYKTLTAGSNITITPAAGAITVASTLQGLVFPETYGAMGNGTNDDTEAINSALATGLNVWLTPGKTYLTWGGHFVVLGRPSLGMAQHSRSLIRLFKLAREQPRLGLTRLQ